MRILPLGALLLVSACKVVDAPATLEEMMVFGFVNAVPGPEIDARGEELPALIRKHKTDLEDGYRVDSLTRADLTQAGVSGKGKVSIIGAMGRIEYLHDLDEVVEAITHRSRDQIAENTTEFEVLDDSDRGCFLRQECETYVQTARQVTKQPVIGELEQTFTQEWVWIDADGRDGIASRILAPDPVDFSSGIAKVEQQYSFYVVSQQAKGGTERVEAIWAEGKLLGADLPDSFLVNNAVNAMGKQAERVDAWLDGE